MDYRLAWETLKQMIERRETHLKDKSKTDKKRTEDLTKGELSGISIIQQFMFDLEADAGLYTADSERPLTIEEAVALLDKPYYM